MSKRVRSSRLAKGRRLRPASEAGAGEARTSDPGEVSLAPPAEASGEIGREPIPGPPDSGEVLSSRGSAARDREEDPISDVAAVATPAPPAVKAVDFDDRAAEPSRPSEAAAPTEAAAPSEAAPSEAASPTEAAPSEATPAPLEALPAVEATEARASVEPAATPAPSGTSTGKKKKKKKGTAARVSDAGPAPSEAASEVAHDAPAGHEEDELSHQFYSTMPPPHLDHDEDHEAARPVALTPEVLERKAKLRRIVGGICAAAALVVVMVAGKALFENKGAPTAAPSAMVEAEAPREEPAKPEAAKPTPAPVAPVDPAKAAEDAKKAEEAEKAKAEEAEKAKTEEAEKAKAEEAEKAKAEEAEKAKGDPAELKKTASKLYNSGKLKDAIPALRAAIAADPADALYYLFLGDSLTNSGKWPEAKEAYNECMRNATKGPKHECAAMGGRK